MPVGIRRLTSDSHTPGQRITILNINEMISCACGLTPPGCREIIITSFHIFMALENGQVQRALTIHPKIWAHSYVICCFDMSREKLKERKFQDFLSSWFSRPRVNTSRNMSTDNRGIDWKKIDQPELVLQRFSSRRSQVYGTKGVVASSQPLATEAGLEILRKGGNAGTSTDLQ